MPDGSASELQSGIIIVEAKVGRLLIMVCGYPICGCQSILVVPTLEPGARLVIRPEVNRASSALCEYQRI